MSCHLENFLNQIYVENKFNVMSGTVEYSAKNNSKSNIFLLDTCLHVRNEQYGNVLCRIQMPPY